MKKIKNFIFFLLILFLCIVISSIVFATDLTNDETQFMELKVVSISDTEDNGKQVLLEWRSYNLKFQGLDLRFSYDETKVKPSKVSDNSYVTILDGEESFQFENMFSPYMGYFTLSVDDGEYRCVMDLEVDNKEVSDNPYIQLNDFDEYEVNTYEDGGVLLGRMSFRLEEGATIDNETFALKPDSNSPLSGIRIVQKTGKEITDTDSYNDPSVFKFTVMNTDASLKNIDYGFFNYNEEKEKPELEYQKLDIDNPDEEEENLSIYKITLNDYLDNISLKIEKSDPNAKVKIDEEEIDTSTTKELVLNKLGEEDTIINIVVTAQDETTQHTYRLVIHRPYAKIYGSIVTPPTTKSDEDSRYKANIRVYDAKVVNEKINWDEYMTVSGDGDDLHSKITEIDSLNYETKDNGTYEIYVIPGTYHILIDKPAYLDCLYINKTLVEGQELDLGNKTLIVGDLDKNGLISISDYSIVYSIYNASDPEELYTKNKDFDFNEDLTIDVSETSYIFSNYLNMREIIK